MITLSTTILVLIRCAFTQVQLDGLHVCKEPLARGYVCAESPTPVRQYWRFDDDAKRCRTFDYYGCGGNGNRFASEHDCRFACAPLAACGHGDPMLDEYGEPHGCDVRRPCTDAAYGCQPASDGAFAVCCPSSQYVCRLPVDGGQFCGATAARSRFYFDAGLRTCRRFTFAGCGGNGNNFASRGYCMTFCATVVPCAVGDPLPDAAISSRPRLCDTDGDCPAQYACNDKQHVCCLHVQHVCGLDVDKGARCSAGSALSQPLTFTHHTVDEKLLRWHYSMQSGLCQSFDYMGCGGNVNNFATVEQCSEYCMGTCPFDSVAHTNAFSGQPQLCALPFDAHACPVGFECTRVSPRASMCCSAPPRCPSVTSNVYVDTSALHSAGPVRCKPEVNNTCPNGYHCMPAPNKEHVCCSLPLSCPVGMSPLRSAHNGRMEPRTCAPGVPGTCDSAGGRTYYADYMCLPSRHYGHVNLCCAPQRWCVMPVMHSVTGEPIECSVEKRSQCDNGSLCLPLPDTDRPGHLPPVENLEFYCCYDVRLPRCADGTEPVMESSGAAAMQCYAPDPNACPVGHRCQRMDDGTYACCRSSPVVEMTDSPLATPKRVSTDRRYCNVAYLHADNFTPVRCAGWDDSATCDNGVAVCRKARNDNFYCCVDPI